MDSDFIVWLPVHNKQTSNPEWGVFDGAGPDPARCG